MTQAELEIYRCNVLRARKMTVNERLVEGLRLRQLELDAAYKEVALVMSDATETEIWTEVRRREYEKAAEENAEFNRMIQYLPVP